jgi:endogenous inhibitor of DNA gyrase (YacG/DUF329 family)
MICPTCKRTFEPPSPGKDPPGSRAPTAPFCSARCRSADLGNWLAGAYRLSAPASDEDLDQGPPAANDDDDGTPSPVN